MNHTAIFGGTFNPFHIGHYEILKTLCKQEFLDSVFLMPDKIPPHKICDDSIKDSDRIEMCRLGCEHFEKAELCLIEFEREGKSYTFDTVCELEKMYPERKFSIVCGGDMIASLSTWYRFDELKNKTDFIAFNRNFDERFSDNIKQLVGLGAKITVIDKEIPAVSSTELRKKVEKSKLPPEIYKYIMEKGLYNE